MTNNQLDLVLPVNQSFPELISLLQSSFTIQVQAENISHRKFYDTFDWLLYNNGAVLEMHEDDQFHRIYWRENKDAELRIQLGLNRIPHLARELPECGFREQLESLISVRELIPKITIKIKRLPIVVLDKHEKVVVRINLEEHWFFPSKVRAGTLLGKRLIIKKVKGYPEYFQQVQALFEPMELRPAQDNMLKLALAESGNGTSDYTKKLNLFLDPDMPAEEALKEILLRLLMIMQQNTSGSIRGRDIEFMHDYRVSIRKTRSALTLVNNVLPGDIVKRYKKFFSGLGKLTNPVRDLDVFLLEINNYQRVLSKSEQGKLQPLHHYLQEMRAEAQKKFVETVKSDEYRTTINEWQNYLQHSDLANPSQENTGKPAFKLANQLIWDTYQLALEEGNAITDETEAEAVHELRKTCKKLRYLMEFFQSLYPARRILELINILKGLQDNLGKFNDLHVHAVILKDFKKQYPDTEARKACESMINSLQQKQHKTRSRFSDKFASFAEIDNQNEFKELFVDAHREQE